MANKIRQVWESVPSQLAKENKKFLYSVIKESARAREYESALNWLRDAGLINKVHRVNKTVIPLKAYEDLAAFLIFIHDVGLLCSLSSLSVKVLLEGNRLFTEFKGSLIEEFVCQQLLSELNSVPFYWSAKDGKSEIDFIIQADDKVIPIEVKAEINLQAKSLKQYIETNKTEFAFRFSLANFCNHGILKDIPLYDLPICKKWI